MKISSSSFKFGLTLILVLSAFSLHAETLNVKCDKKSLATAIGNLDKSASNTVNITSDCNEDIVISGHKDLTLIGHGGASITATVFDPDPGGDEISTLALRIETSNVTFQDLTINGGRRAVQCVRSVCELRNVTIPSGWSGVSGSLHSKLYILGSSWISTNGLGNGVSVFSDSHLIIAPTGLMNWSEGDAGPVITGNFIGVQVQESFLRSDNVSIIDNEIGIFARRNSTIRVFSNWMSSPIPPALVGGVSNNSWRGIWLQSSSTAQIGTPITDNADGILVGPLSLIQNAWTTFENNGADLTCTHPTSVDLNFGLCPAIEDWGERISELETQVAELTALLEGVSRFTKHYEGDPVGYDTMQFSGMNVQIVNGEDQRTYTGEGNLIIGYNGARGGSECPDGDMCDRRTGSHNLVMGYRNNYTAHGGLVSGGMSEIAGGNASVLGGHYNLASGTRATVTGGENNIASGWRSSVSGGINNQAIGPYASVSGGQGNTASGQEASVSGGEFNIASGDNSSVSGGRSNEASAHDATVSGGQERYATGQSDWAAGSLYEDD